MQKVLNEKDLYLYCPLCSNKLELKQIDDQNVKACTKCDFIFWNDPKPTTSVLIQEDDAVLMLQRAKKPLKNYWVLPGGFVKYEEDPKQTIERESKEELGSDVEINGIVGIYRIDNDPRGIHIDLIFNGELKGEIILSKEHKDFRYFSKDGLPDNIAYKHREAIIDWFTKGGQYS